jgi:hypothetical protein
MKQRTANVSSTAKAEIFRALYDAADRVVEEQCGDGSLAVSPSSAFSELDRVISRARELGGDEFAQTIEVALNKYTELIFAAQDDCVSNTSEDK